jgi:hypothetical protein
MAADKLDLCFWSQPAVSESAAASAPAATEMLAISGASEFRLGRLRVPRDGTLVLSLTSPRPMRVWVGRNLVLDESLFWRFYNRRLYCAAVVPVAAGECEVLFQFGPRPAHSARLDQKCPSRRRDEVVRRIAQRIPDRLELTATLVDGAAPAVALTFAPTQFVRDGITYQKLTAKPLMVFLTRPNNEKHPAPAADYVLTLQSNVLPRLAIEKTLPHDREAGARTCYVPVAHPGDEPGPVRQAGPEDRPEPSHEIARMVQLTVDGVAGSVSVPMPAFESTGRLAPRTEYREIDWPTPETLSAGIPEPILPPEFGHYKKLYNAAWSMFLQLLRRPAAESGATNSYVATGASFGLVQFVWDSSFTSMCLGYGWRALNPYANLDNLYRTQFDGGYIHREVGWEEGLPYLYEPDFSPNPPLMSVAEWQIARLTGNVLRLGQVYEALKANHIWLQHNRRLPDGTYWTTGLANGLDNSPSLGDGYPDLTAQMVHEAEILGEMAAVLGKDAEARGFASEREQTAEACNQRLWSDAMQIYSTSLAGGGHNPNKVVTAFWPLWAGIVPPQRVEALAQHLLDPKSFWRHHPVPSLAADSPHYRPAGDYWLGSTWAPTNYMVVSGFDRAGRHDLAVKTAARHLDCMYEVYQATGEIWENYCAEAPRRGSWSGSPYCWSALGPIAMLLETLIGVHADALSRTLTWNVPDGDRWGVRNYALGGATVALQVFEGAGQGPRRAQVSTTLPISLVLRSGGKEQRLQVAAGTHEYDL